MKRQLAVALTVAITTAAIVTAALITRHDSAEDCGARGGHVGPKSLCLTPDGRVIEK